MESIILQFNHPSQQIGPIHVTEIQYKQRNDEQTNICKKLFLSFPGFYIQQNTFGVKEQHSASVF